jgi:molecular chaperone DnaK
MLKVTARERATGLNKQVTIENALSEFIRDEHDQARARIDQLWAESGIKPAAFGDEPASVPLLTLVPAGAPEENHGHRETVQARALIEKAERLMVGVSAEDRAEIERLCGQLRGAVDERHWQRAETVTGELSDLLFYIEDA